MAKDNNDTIVSLISSSTGGSVSSLRISGPASHDMAKRHFRTTGEKKLLAGHFYYGIIVDREDREIDQVILLYYGHPHSYTGEDVIEIHCHANPFIVSELLDVFQSSGCRIAEPGEFTKRAFINGKLDLIQAEAVADLIMSKSKAGVKNSLMQVEGKLSSGLNEIKQILIDTASLMELDLDFSEEDLDIIETEDIDQRLHNITDRIDQLIDSYKYGQVFKQGIEVLITGKPNVGKSSLMNAFLERDRVIVSEIPGTTRDMVHEDIVIENTMIRFIDSAGIRITKDLIEEQGVSRAHRYMDHADIIILLIDSSQPLNQEDIELIEKISELYSRKTIICGNKSDLGIVEENQDRIKTKTARINYISALDGRGLDEIKRKIIEKIHQVKDHISEEIMISNERQFHILKECRTSVIAARQTLNQNLGFEFVSIDLRKAISHLSEITGEITTDDILNNIFSRFCIGK